MWKLVIIDDAQAKTVVNLVRDEYAIGRGEGHAVRLTERNISRNHARMVRTRLGFRIEDSSSYNGVYVNGVRVVGRQDLAHGDLVQIGDYRIFVVDEALATQEQGYRPYDSVVPASGRLPHRLVQLIGPQQGAEFPLEGDRFLLGRGTECEFTIDHSSVSRVHAEVRRVAPDRFEIVDKGSANGLRLNGRDMGRSLLDGRDVIEMGDVVLKYIPQGQVFRASAVEGARIAALAGSAPPPAETQARMGIAPSLFAAVLGALLVGALFWMLSDGDVPTPETSAPLEEASRLVASGDLVEAGEALRRLEEDSSTMPRLLPVAERWAQKVLKDGKNLTEDERRQLLNQIARSALLPDRVRETAAQRLAQPSHGAVDVNALESE